MRLMPTPLLLLALAAHLPAAELIRGLGGSEGFGEGALARNDDGYINVNLTSIWPAGLRYFGTDYTSVWLNNNGNLTFNGGSSTFTPGYITASGVQPIIAAWYADVDTRNVPGEDDGQLWRGGNRTNLVYYDLDTTRGIFTATWDAVGYFSNHNDKRCSFQIRLLRYGSGKEFDIELRYGDLAWTTGDASGGTNGLGGTIVRAGYSAGNGTSFFELPQSGNQNAMLALVATPGNTGTVGIWNWRVRKPNVLIAPAITHSNAATINFTLSVPVDATGFDASDITVTGGTAGALSAPVTVGVDRVYTLPVTTVPGTVVVTVIAGRVSSPFAEVNDQTQRSVIIDVVPPGVPSVPTVSGGIISGTCEAFATVHILLNGVEVATTTADAGGNWSWTPSGIGSGDYTVTVTATDQAGNNGPASGGSPFSYTAPAKEEDDDGGCGGGLTGLLILPLLLLGLRKRRD